jgi:hypothetical protein
MNLIIQNQAGATHAIEINPNNLGVLFDKMRASLYLLPGPPRRFLCDREARHWMQIAAMRGYDGNIAVATDGIAFTCTFAGVPIEIED